ncbi:MAG: type transport system permease protein, partial [Actinomycetota bacterium]
MTAIRRTTRILRYSALGGIQDFFAMYTVGTWVFGWLMRVIVQVIFYALIGSLLHSDARLHFILVGNAVFLAASTTMFVVQSTTWERSGGTLGLLIVAPANPLIVLLG